jgi:hypothetical protein
MERGLSVGSKNPKKFSAAMSIPAEFVRRDDRNRE